MRNSLVLFLFLTLTPLIGLAATSDVSSIPWDTIKLQVLNFAVFFAIVAMLVKFKANPILEKMKNEYLQHANEAKQKLEEAKNQRDELSKKIADLEGEYTQSLEMAKKDSEEKKKLQISNAKKNADEMHKDLDRKVEALKLSYANEIKNELVNTSINELKLELDEGFDEASFNQLQKNFVDRMDVRL